MNARSTRSSLQAALDVLIGCSLYLLVLAAAAALVLFLLSSSALERVSHRIKSWFTPSFHERD